MGTQSTGDAENRGTAGPETGPGTGTAGVDWSELDGAYGATEVLEALEGLTDPELADDAVDDLYSTVLHQGTLYPASGPAVVEVARLLAAGRCANPTGALGLVAYYSQCVQEHRAALAFLRAYPRGYRRAEDRLGGYQARLDEAVDVLAPLLAGLGSFDPLAAQALTLLQGRRSRLDPQRAAVLGELASAGPGPEGGPDAAIARAAAFTLGRHGLGVPDTPEARTCALLGRVAGSRASEEDARTLAADWSTALGVADVCLNELTDDIPDPSLPMWLAVADPRLAVTVLTALPADAGGASTEVIEALTEAVLRSRGATPPALERLLELAERPDADPDTMVGALRLMRSRPEARDALARLAARPEALRPGRHRGTPRTDAAYALATQGDGRWAGLFASALRARPDPSDLRLNGMTGFMRDFAATGAAPVPELLDAVAGLLTDPAATDDAVEAVLDLVGDWAERWPTSLLSSLAPALERVRADRPQSRKALKILASWGDAPTPARRRDATAQAWSKQGRQLAAARRRVDSGQPVAGQLPLVLAMIEGAGRDVDEVAGDAAALAVQWDRAGLLDPGDAARLRSLLTEAALRDPADPASWMGARWMGARPLAQVAAVIVSVTGWPGTPEQAAELVAACVTSGRLGDLDAGMDLAESLAEAAADARVGEAVAEVLTRLLDADERISRTSDGVAEDERTCDRLQALVARLTARLPARPPAADSSLSAACPPWAD